MRSAIALTALIATLSFAGSAAADEPEAPAPAPPAPAPPAPAPAAQVTVEQPASTQVQGRIPPGAKYPGDGQRLVGAVVGAAGFLTLAVGGFLTISAMTLYDEAEGRCRNGTCARSDVRDASLARDRANAGGYVLLGGLALLGGGIALYYTATPRPKVDEPPAPPPAQVGIAPSLGGLAAFGTF